MSTRPSLAPCVLDVTVLHELARGDVATIGLIQGYDAANQPMVLSTLATTRTLVDTPSAQATDAIRGLTALERVMVAPLRDTEQAIRLANLMTVTALDVWDAHVAAIADNSICPILTYDADRWRDASDALDQPLPIIEISEPGL